MTGVTGAAPLSKLPVSLRGWTSSWRIWSYQGGQPTRHAPQRNSWPR